RRLQEPVVSRLVAALGRPVVYDVAARVLHYAVDTGVKAVLSVLDLHFGRAGGQSVRILDYLVLLGGSPVGDDGCADSDSPVRVHAPYLEREVLTVRYGLDQEPVTRVVLELEIFVRRGHGRIEASETCRCHAIEAD